jgi:putative redox protein
MSLISITRKRGQNCEIQVRAHSVTSDLSTDDGGSDQGPSPSELLVSSLGACIVMMVQRYCDRHEYRGGDVAASLTYELAEEPKRVGVITIDLEVPTDVPEDKLAVIRRVAEACPIHGTLTKPPEIDLEIFKA